MDELLLREANFSDAPAICEISEKSLGYPTDLKTVEKNLIYTLTTPFYKVLVVEANGIVAGFAEACDYVSLYSGRLKNIMSLAILPDFQGQGLGKRLLDAMEEWALEEGYEGTRLGSQMKRVDAHQFYLHCGYTEKKQHKIFQKMFKK